MKVLISGSTGLIGTKLVGELESKGHAVVRLVRGENRAGEESIQWSPEKGEMDSSRLEGFDAVVHLAGESIASGRWSPAKKHRIRDSRLIGTRTLAEKILTLKSPPRVVVSGSAIGYYGDRGDMPVDESSPAGTGFLAEVCREWEEAARPVTSKGARLVLLRTGVVLDRNGGALGKMRVPFSLGLGGPLGSGRQYMSWISLDDIVGVILFALTTAGFEGPVNGVSPRPVTNAEFTRTLGSVMHRPAIFPVPRVGARLLFGEMSDALLFSSQRVLPNRLARAGYQFRHPELRGALEAALSSR